MPQPECAGKQARVTQNTRLADLNLPAAHRVDDRRTEVIANRLAFWNGSQLAVDTTLVSPLTSTGGTTSPSGELCRSCTPRCQKIQRKGLPRTPTIKSLPACRFGYGSRRTMEPRSNPVLVPPGTQQSTRCSTCSPPIFHYRFARQMDSHTHPCGHARICVVFPFPAHGQLPRGRPRMLQNQQKLSRPHVWRVLLARKASASFQKKKLSSKWL